jgi:hypothetical protein
MRSFIICFTKFCYGDEIKENERDRLVPCMGEMRNAYKVLVSMPEGKRLPGRPRCRWEGNIRMDLRKRGWQGVDWMCPTWVLVVGSCEHGNEPLCFIKGRDLIFLNSCVSRKTLLHSCLIT